MSAASSGSISARRSDARSLGQVVDDVGLQLVLEFGDRVGGLLVVEVVEDPRALRRRELLEDVGDVGRVQLVQALVGDRQLDLREVAVEQVHVVPRDEVLVRAGRRRACATPRDERARARARCRAGCRATPTSAPSSRSWLRDSESLRSLTRTTFMPWVSTICLFMQVAREQDLVGLQVAEADVRRGDVERDAARRRTSSTYLRHESMNGVLSGPLNASEVTRGKTSPVAIAMSLMVPISSPVASTTGLPSIWDR